MQFIAPKSRVFESVLNYNETIFWIDQPNPRRVFRAAHTVLIPLVWLLLILFCVMLLQGTFSFTLIISPATWSKTVQSWCWLLLLFYLSIGHFIVRFLHRHATYYAVTDQRILVRYGLLFPKVRTIELSTITVIQPIIDEEHKEGAIWFGEIQQETMSISRSFFDLFILADFIPGLTDIGAIGFESIRNVEQVHSLVYSLRASVKDEGDTPAPLVPVTWKQPQVMNLVSSLLENGETLRWIDQPLSTRLLCSLDWALIPLGLLLGIFLLVEPALWYSIIIPAIVAFLLIIRFVGKYLVKRRTYYVVTDRRLLVIRRLVPHIDIQEIRLTFLPVLEEIILGDGSGIIRFGRLPAAKSYLEESGLVFLARDGYGKYSKQDPIEFPLTFYHIPQVHQVAHLVNRLAATARKKPDSEKWTEFQEYTHPLTNNLPVSFKW